jgi:hypothetical protein
MLLQSLLVLCRRRLHVRCLRSSWFSIFVAPYTMCATCTLFLFYLLCLLFFIFSISLISINSLVFVNFIALLTYILNT